MLCILTAGTYFDKSTRAADISNSTANNDSSVAEAFRSPAAGTVPKKVEGLRLRIREHEPLRVNQIRPVGWAAVWGWFFPNATVVELSGKLDLTLHIYPSHVQIAGRRWFTSGFPARLRTSIPVYDEIGDDRKHLVHVRCVLAFLYPFVPMHVEVRLDDETVFGQGKFQQQEARSQQTSSQ